MIKKPFSYMGSKDRFYKEIKKIIVLEGKEKYVDLFAGGLTVPLSLKKDFPNMNILANVKDKQLETMIHFAKKGKLETIYFKILGMVMEGGYKIDSARNIYNKDREKFDKLKSNFSSIWNTTCKHCGSKVKRRDKARLSDEESEIAKLFFGYGGKSQSLSSCFYSKAKVEAIRKYIEALKTINITTNYFDETNDFNDSFIFLDPPYIQKTKVDEDKNFIGYSYSAKSGVEWNLKDDERLIKFVKRNRNRNNTFFLFGSKDNNLQKLLEKEFGKELELEFKEYNANTFGKATKRGEWFGLLRI